MLDQDSNQTWELPNYNGVILRVMQRAAAKEDRFWVQQNQKSFA